MLRNRDQLSLMRMASVLGVSRSGFHRWANKRYTPSLRAEKQSLRDLLIREAFDRSKSRSGAGRIQKELEEAGHSCCLKTIQDSMRRQNLIPKAARKFKVTTDSKHSLPVAPNLLKRDFSTTEPNQKWAGDITYLQTTEGWLYLAVVIDLFSRKVIGWSMDTTMKSSLVCDALNMALWRRKFPEGGIFHSDRGSQYCSEAFRGALGKHNVLQSMSRKGDCWDNACVESFFHSLKVESVLYEPMINREQMRQAVFEYIEVDYNRTRRHSSLGYLSPEKYELTKVA